MKKIIASYEKLHPNVTIKAVVQSTGTWTQTQHIACKGKSGPDLWYNWSGTWSLEQAWQGCTVPNEAVLSRADLGHNTNLGETTWQGKSWAVSALPLRLPARLQQGAVQAGRARREQASADVGAFLAACKKLKAAGVQPIVLGLKDGFGGEILGRRRSRSRSSATTTT